MLHKIEGGLAPAAKAYGVPIAEVEAAVPILMTISSPGKPA